MTTRKLLSGSLMLLLIFAGCAGSPEPKRAFKPVPVRSELQAWADHNQNGMLEQPEVQELVQAFWTALKDPHPVHSPLDERFDRNHDGQIGPRELDELRHGLFLPLLFDLYQFAPHMAELIDQNHNRRIEEHEAAFAMEYLFYAEQFRKPHKVENPVDERIDRNRNGFVEEQELRNFGRQLVTAVALLPLPEEPRGEPPLVEMPRGEGRAVSSFLDELADTNRDGMVDDFELEQMEEGLSGPHRVETEFDHLLDFNRNGRVEDFEIDKARRGEGVAYEEQEPLPVRTAVDGIFDFNKNGMVEADEIGRVVDVFLGNGFPVERETPLLDLLDADHDRFVSEDELFRFKELYLLPHPVRRNVPEDRRLDKNNNGFIEPEEIGIAAGFSPGKMLPPFDERIERKRREMEVAVLDLPDGGDSKIDRPEEPGTDENRAKVDVESYQKKVRAVEGKKVAVIGVEATTESITSETSKGLVAFIENAFVNIGTAKVVDRKNIEKIQAEQKLQLSGTLDETTAVQLGKLSGADIVVMGNISVVGDKYYLGVKLLSVETGEILGSTMVEGEGSSEFYSMCNTAVAQLF